MNKSCETCIYYDTRHHMGFDGVCEVCLEIDKGGGGAFTQYVENSKKVSSMEEFKGKYIFDDRDSKKCDAFLSTMNYIEKRIRIAKERAFYSPNPDKFYLSIYLFNEGNFQGWMYREMIRDIITVLRQQNYIVSCDKLILHIEAR